MPDVVRSPAVIHVERWGTAHQLGPHDSFVLCDVRCASCGNPFEVGQYARARYGPHGGTPFHDDCTTSRDGDTVEVVCRSSPACRVRSS